MYIQRSTAPRFSSEGPRGSLGPKGGGLKVELAIGSGPGAFWSFVFPFWKPIKKNEEQIFS